MQPQTKEEDDEVFIMIPRKSLIARIHTLDRWAVLGFKTGIFARKKLVNLLGEYGKMLITTKDLNRLRLAKEKEEDG